MGAGDGKHIRIGSINLNNTLPWAEGDERLFREVHARHIQVLCMQEVGCNWKNMDSYMCLQHRLDQTFGPQETRSVFKHTIHDLTGTTKQWGGTGILSKGKIRHFTKDTGGDPTGLGRWTWVRVQGKQGMILRYVSVYCPCKSKHGMLTVWTQQKTYLQSRNDNRDPRKAFMEDLAIHIEQRMQEGDQVLICGDLNHDVRSQQVTKMFEDLHLVHLIYAKHDATNAPSTHFLKEDGRIVDGIWGSPGLVATRCGYLRPEEFPGNRLLL
jgi:exonuclease III